MMRGTATTTNEGMMRGMWTALVVGLVIAFAAGPRSASGQTFLANNGVMYGGVPGDGTGDGTARVVVDGLFRFYRDIYPPLPDSLRLGLESAERPFDGIGFILSTHRHGDHMHPEAVAKHLCAAPDVVALVPEQIRGAVIEAAACQISLERLISGTEIVQRGGIAVRAVPVPHITPDRFADIENRAYVIQSAGGRIVHLGDSNLSEELAAEPIDVLSTPFWNIGEERFMRLWEQAGKPFLIAVHVSPGDHARLRARYADMELDVWVPERPMETPGDQPRD